MVQCRGGLRIGLWSLESVLSPLSASRYSRVKYPGIFLDTYPGISPEVGAWAAGREGGGRWRANAYKYFSVPPLTSYAKVRARCCAAPSSNTCTPLPAVPLTLPPPPSAPA
jgi:hypothetical protein